MPGIIWYPLLKRAIDAHLAESATQADLGHIKLQEDWIVATLSSGWTGTAKYAKNDLGFVTIYGSVTAGTVTTHTSIMWLPVGYRPMTLQPIVLLTVSAPTPKNGLYVHGLDGGVKVTGTDLVGGTAYVFVVSYYAE